MSRIYSARLFAGGPSGPGLFSTVVGSDGDVVVVRDMTITNQHPAGTALQGFNLMDSSGLDLLSVRQGEAWSVRNYGRECRHVLPDDRIIELQLNDDEWTWVVSGYILTPS